MKLHLGLEGTEVGYTEEWSPSNGIRYYRRITVWRKDGRFESSTHHDSKKPLTHRQVQVKP